MRYCIILMHRLFIIMLYYVLHLRCRLNVEFLLTSKKYTISVHPYLLLSIQTIQGSIHIKLIVLLNSHNGETIEVEDVYLDHLVFYDVSENKSD